MGETGRKEEETGDMEEGKGKKQRPRHREEETGGPRDLLAGRGEEGGIKKNEEKHQKKTQERRKGKERKERERKQQRAEKERSGCSQERV